MKTRISFFVMLSTIPMLVACGNGKTVSSPANGGLQELSEDVTQNQQLNAAEVGKVKRTKFLRTRSEKNEIVAATSYKKKIVSETPAHKDIVVPSTSNNKVLVPAVPEEKKVLPVTSDKKETVTATSDKKETVIATSGKKEVVYAKSKKMKKREKKIAEANVNKTIVQNAPKTVTVVVTQDTVVKAVVLKDTLTKISTIVEPMSSTDNIAPIDSMDLEVPDADTTSLFSPYMIVPYLQPTSKLKKFSVVVGSYQTLEQAFDMILKMEKAKYKPIVIKSEKGMYRVIVGTYNDRDNAEIDKIALEFDSYSSWILSK